MADHDKGVFDSLKNTPGMEFWRLYEIFKRKVDKERAKQ